MTAEPDHDVTRLLAEACGGDKIAAEQLLPRLYGELRRLARTRLAREQPGQTLQATALVHEAYLRLIGPGVQGWDSRGHFFASAAEAMRRILVERARRYARVRHGGERQRVDLSLAGAAGDEADAATEELIELDRALVELEKRDRTMAEVVKLRYFAGLSVEETALAIESSPRTVKRRWAAARAWLRREMGAARER